MIIFAVESEPTGNYTNTRQELWSVEKTVVRDRVVGPVPHAEDHGSHAGHGFRVGDQVDVPRSRVLVAARPIDPKTTGYDSHGEAAASLKPSDATKKTYRVKPGTPYDLILPYRTAELAWFVDEKLVKMIHIGEKANFEQVMFTEDSLRGDVTVRAPDEDPKEGTRLRGPRGLRPRGVSGGRCSSGIAQRASLSLFAQLLVAVARGMSKSSSERLL